MSSHRRIVREPLLHFVALGAALFVAYGLIPGERAAPGEIVVTRGKVEQLATGFAKVWQRPPSESEIKGLIDDWVREEIAVREATAMGLDRDDTVVRRLLRQKLEFLSDDVAQAAPTEADLRSYLAAHPEKFRVERRYSFRHVYLNPQRHESDLQPRLNAVREALNRPGADNDFTALGDPSLLEPQYDHVSANDVETQFGPTFAAALGRLTPAQWEGPVQSGYGLHFVQLREQAEGGAADLAEVGDTVRREWANDRRSRALETFYDALLKGCTVRIEAVVPAGNEARP